MQCGACAGAVAVAPFVPAFGNDGPQESQQVFLPCLCCTLDPHRLGSPFPHVLQHRQTGAAPGHLVSPSLHSLLPWIETRTTAAPRFPSHPSGPFVWSISPTALSSAIVTSTRRRHPCTEIGIAYSSTPQTLANAATEWRHASQVVYCGGSAHPCYSSQYGHVRELFHGRTSCT